MKREFFTIVVATTLLSSTAQAQKTGCADLAYRIGSQLYNRVVPLGSTAKYIEAAARAIKTDGAPGEELGMDHGLRLVHALILGGNSLSEKDVSSLVEAGSSNYKEAHIFKDIVKNAVEHDDQETLKSVRDTFKSYKGYLKDEDIKEFIEVVTTLAENNFEMRTLLFQLGANIDIVDSEGL